MCFCAQSIDNFSFNVVERTFHALERASLDLERMFQDAEQKVSSEEKTFCLLLLIV